MRATAAAVIDNGSIVCLSQGGHELDVVSVGLINPCKAREARSKWSPTGPNNGAFRDQKSTGIAGEPHIRLPRDVVQRSTHTAHPALVSLPEIDWLRPASSASTCRVTPIKATIGSDRSRNKGRDRMGVWHHRWWRSSYITYRVRRLLETAVYYSGFFETWSLGADDEGGG